MLLYKFSIYVNAITPCCVRCGQLKNGFVLCSNLFYYIDLLIMQKKISSNIIIAMFWWSLMCMTSIKILHNTCCYYVWCGKVSGMFIVITYSIEHIITAFSKCGAVHLSY